MSISTEIQRLQNAKSNLKTSINNKLGSQTNIANETLEDYASFVDNISTGVTPTGTINITENGTHNVTNYASANVNVPSDTNDVAFSIINKSITELKPEYLVGLTRLSPYCFAYCNAVKNWNVFPNTLTELSNYAFYASGYGKDLKLPSSVNSFLNYALASSSFKVIDLSDTILTSLPIMTMQNCGQLQKVMLPSTLTSMLGGSIYNDSKLETVIVLAINPPTKELNVFQLTPIDKSTTTGFIYVPDGSVNAYKSATNWSTYADKIKGISELPTE